MFKLIILTLLLNLPITPMPSEQVVIDGVRGIRPIVAPHKVNWWQDSALPGEGSNVVLYGHSTDPQGGLPGAGVFAGLHTIQPGAVITVTLGGRDYGYVVSRVMVVDETEPASGKLIEPTEGEQLTLVTCFDNDRLIVIATPWDDASEDAKASARRGAEPRNSSR